EIAMGAAVIAIHPVEKRMPAAPKHAASCSSCNLRELCLPGALDGEDLARVDHLVYARRRLKRGEALYQAGTEFNAIYAIRSGSFKASLFDGEGHEQVSGFFMGGELLGLEGLGSGSYQASAIALEDSEICVLPYSLIEQLCREIPALQRRLHTVLAREIVRDHGVMMLLGTMRAEQRLATFLLNLSARSKRRGYSSPDSRLLMSREEMGSYLGLKLETVSRLFSQFHEARLIEVDYRHVRIVDVQGLQRLVSS